MPENRSYDPYDPFDLADYEPPYSAHVAAYNAEQFAPTPATAPINISTYHPRFTLTKKQLEAIDANTGDNTFAHTTFNYHLGE